jgi:inosose dehydratase
MNESSKVSRRGFVGGGLALAAAPLVAPGSPARAAAVAFDGPAAGPALKLGVATYSFIRFPLDKTLASLRRVGVHFVSVKDAHLPLKSTVSERKAVFARFRDAGITPLSLGVSESQHRLEST